jgi:predicted RND superfamily exporter protein
MVSWFYKHYSKHLLWIAVLSFPYLYYQAETMPSNNDIETWLPRESDVRSTYEDFKLEFGAEEIILIGLSGQEIGDPLVESLASRIERLSGIRTCWSPARLQTVMSEFDVNEAESLSRLKGLAISDDGKMLGVVALLSPDGLADRAAVVEGVRREIAYCQFASDDVHLAGGPILVSELDRLGNRAANKRFFMITLVICLGLLYWSLRQWKLALSIVGLTVWAINCTLGIMKLAGGEMNFILGALSVMVMVFTLAVAVHFLHYYRALLGSADPLGEAFRLAWKPCSLATLTTTIGLISLTVSDIAPVCQFGYAAAMGSVVALLTGLGLTPAVLTCCPPMRFHEAGSAGGRFTLIAMWLLDRKKTVTALAVLIVVGTSLGVPRIRTKIDPLDFLPKDGKVYSDVARIERDLTTTHSIEAVVDFGDSERAFVDKLADVRELDRKIRCHPAVRHTMSLTTFFPEQLPDDPLETMELLNRARSQQSENDYLASGTEMWRISARIQEGPNMSRQQILDDLQALTAGSPVHFTGVAPLLEHAQHEIFDGFWESFAMAFGIISIVMIVSLRSLKAGLVAMVPNLTPICIVFGTLGWLDFPVDIGMMMTASIALGIAVDGTFHFLLRYEEHYKEKKDSARASRFALLQTGAPIFEAATIASVGMLALTLSNFAPTARFGYMMTALMLAAVIGDLVLLPALLSFRPSQRLVERWRPKLASFTRHDHTPAAQSRSKGRKSA